MVKIKDAFKKAQEILKENGIEDFKSDAFFLMTGLFEVDRADFLSDREIDFSVLENALERRIKGEPCAYITGETEFMSLPFKVNKNVLIPRQDTENLVEYIINSAKGQEKILDLCTGSGCVGISLKKYIKDASVTMVDISDGAIETAEKNAKLNNADVKIVKDDVLNPKHCYDMYDVLVSNPPYIEKKVIETLENQVKDFEPNLALDGGEDGLVFYRKIAKDFKKHIKNGGMCIFEIGFNQGGAVKEILEENGFTDVEIIRDYNDNDRIVRGTRNESNIQSRYRGSKNS